VAACLSHTHGRAVAVVGVRTEPLKYDPGTGCTCRVSGSAQVGDASVAFDLVGKTHRSDRLARTFATMSRLADPAVRSGSWRIARPLFYDAGRKLLWQEALRGRSFWTLYPNLDVAATFRRMAAAAAAFHAIPFAPAGRELSELPESRPDLIDRWPDLGARHARLLERLLTARGTLSPAEPASLHGDFHPEQFLIDGDQIALTDFDTACWGDAAHDAGRFASHVVLKTLQRDLGPDRFTDSLEAFYDEYVRRSAAANVRPRIFWHVAAQLLG